MNLSEYRNKYNALAGMSDERAVKAIQRVEFPEKSVAEVAKTLGVKMPEEPKPERTWGEAFKDTGAALLGGGAGLVKGAGDLYGLVSGNMENPVSRLGGDAQEYWDQSKSEALRGKMQQRKENIDAQEGTLGKALVAARDTLTDPALAFDTLAQNAATLLPGMGAGRVVAGIHGTRALNAASAMGPASAAVRASIAARAGTMGTGTAIGVGAMQQGADVSGDIYTEVLKKDEAVWDANPDFIAELERNGGDRAAAKQSIATSVARTAFLPAAGISVAANALPGASYLERALVGGGARKVVSEGAKYALPKAIAKGVLGEGAQEFIEEGGGKLAANMAARAQVDPTHDIWTDVGENAGMGFAGGAMLGGAGGAFNARPAEPKVVPDAGPLSRAANATHAAQTAAADAMARSAQIDATTNAALSAAAQQQATARADELAQLEQPEPLPPQAPPPDVQAAMERQRLAAEAQRQVDRAQASPDDEIYQSIGQVADAPDRVTAEPLRDTAAQVAAVRNPESTKDAALITPNSARDVNLDGLETVETDRGLLVTSNPEKAAAAAANPAMGDAQMGELLGYGAPKNQSDGTVVQSTDANGSVVHQEATAKAGVKAAKERAAAAAPGGKVEVTNAADVQARRSALNGVFDTYEDADAYRREQRKAGGNILALPVEAEGGGFRLAVQGTPEYARGEQLRDERRAAKARADAGIHDGDILTKSGAAFKTKVPAMNAAKKVGDGYGVVPVKGGFVVRPKNAVAADVKNDAQPAAQAAKTPPVETPAPDAGRDAAAEAVPDAGPAGVEAAGLTDGAAQPAKIVGKKIDSEWTAFAPESGTLSVPRAEMPQIKAEHRGAMVNFLKGRGIASMQETVPADSLKPTQHEFSQAKVDKAKKFEGGDRSILVSSDGHVLDGHHQWLAKRDGNEPIDVIRMDAPIRDLLNAAREFPSSTAADGSTEGGSTDRGRNAADPSAFIEAPGGGVDFGEISPEMGKAMRRQAGKIRLQRGAQNADGTGYGLAHIEANHGAQIRALGFDSVNEFVARVASNIQQVWQVPGNSQLLATVNDGRKDVMYVRLEISKDGDFYRVNSAFPVRQQDYEARKGMKKIWDGSEPTSAVTGQRPAFATAASASPETLSSQGSSNARGQSASVPATTQHGKSPSATDDAQDGSVATPQDGIQDFGEKIGGARKDTATKTGTKPTAKPKDDRPAWARRFEVAQAVKASNAAHEGRWFVRDTRSLDGMKQPKRVGSREGYATREEAQDAVKFIAIGQKHRVVSVGEGQWEVWRDISDRKRVKVVDQTFESREAALRYMVEHATDIIETNTTFGEADLPRPSSAERKGVERRTGPAKDSDFMGTFGFRGVEFGNWQNQAERQQLLDDAYDGLLDLAQVMGIPPKAVSLNGELALAFGARGQGLSGARAHYEAGKAVINLTKMNGAGSLAHEWFHALDHYFGRQDGKAPVEWVTDKDGTRSLKVRDGFDANSVSSGTSGDRSGVRAEVRAAIAEVMQTMTRKAEQYVDDTAKADKFVATAREGVQETLARIRVNLAQDVTYAKRNNKPASAEQLAEFDTVAEAITQGESLETALRGDPNRKEKGRNLMAGMRWTNDALERLSAVIKAVRGRSGFNAEHTGELDRLRESMQRYSARLKMLADAQQNTEKTRMVPTEFAMNAKELDQGRGTDYWTTPYEMAARAFQGYVEDKIAEGGGASPFLNYGPENVGIPTPWGWKRPYPHGAERKAINAAFDKLVATIKTRETEGGNVAMFSRTPATRQGYEDRIDALFDGAKANLEGARVLDRSDVLGMLGMGDGPVHLAEGKVVTQKHRNMTADMWKKIPQWLDNPAAVFDSDTVAGRLVLVAPETLNNAAVLMVVEPNGQRKADGVRVHLLQNAYDKDESAPPFGRWLREGKGRYVDQKEFPAILHASGLQLSGTAWQNKPGTPKILTEKNLAGWRRANDSALSRATSAATSEQTSSVQASVNAVKAKWQNAPEVVVVSDMQDAKVPQRVRDHDAQQKSLGATGEPEGFLYGGKVYVLASQVNTQADVARVVMHEALGHYGLHGVFGESLKPILDQIGAIRRAEVVAKAMQYGMIPEHVPADAPVGEKWASMSREQRQQAAEEVLAEMAQTRPELGYVKRAIAAIRSWLRANVPGFAGMRVTDAEIINDYILPARGWVERGSEPDSSMGSLQAAFARAAERDEGNATLLDKIVRPPRQARNFAQARVAAKDFQGKPLTNDATGMTATVSRNNLDKMLNDSAVKKSESPVSHALAVANLDALFKQSQLGWSKPDRDGNANIAAIHRFFATVLIDGEAQLVKLTVKEQRDGVTPNPLYSVEAVEFNEKSPAVKWVAASLESDGIKLTSDPPGRGVQSLAQQVEDFNRSNDGSDAAMFSRAVATNPPNNPQAYKAKAVQTINDLLHAPGTVSWWHKTVGTMHNLARRSPQFAKVYDSVQGFLSDVSDFAAEAANLAPNLLPKLETWRDIGKSPISAEDTKQIAAPIFEGTLLWARDVDGSLAKAPDLEARYQNLTVDEKKGMLLRHRRATEGQIKSWQNLPPASFDGAVSNLFESEFLKAGVVFSDAELRQQFKLSDEKIKLYREFRSATDQSLNKLGITEMLRFAGEDAEGVRQMALDATTADDAAVLLRDHLLQLAKDNPARSDVLTDTANKVIEKADRINGLIEQGYAPLSRFGQYTVDVVTADGERAYFGMFENKREANQMARKMKSNYPDGTVSQGTVSEEGYKMFSGITPETLELFGEMVGLESTGNEANDQMFQEYLKLAKANRSAMKRLIHRKGIAGFSEDAGRVLAGFIYSNARLSATNVHTRQINDAVAAIPKEQGQLKDMAVKLSDYVRNPQEEAQAVRGAMFVQYLGGSLASAFVNMTQPVAVTMPYLSQWGGPAKAANQMKNALADIWKKSTGDAALDAALKHAEDQGVVSPQEVHQLMAQARGRASLSAGDGTLKGEAWAKAGNAYSKLMLGWGKAFSAAEQFNRRVTFIAAYRVAVDNKMANPYEFAKKAIEDTQFVYNKGNKPQWARGAIGGTLFTFKSYSISYVELMHRLATQGGPEGKKAALFMVAMIFLMGGAGGLPFMSDAEDVVDAIMQRLGYAWNTKQARKELLIDVLGKGGAEFVESGISGLPGVPIDVAGRLGLGNLIPGTGLLVKKQDHSRDLLEIAGPAGDLAKRAFEGSGMILGGDLKEGLLAWSPKAVSNAAKGLDMYQSGMYRDQKGRKVIDVDAVEALIKATGFQPKSVADVQEATMAQQSLIQQNKMFKAELGRAMAKAVFEGDFAEQQAVREKMRRWNERNPESPVKIDMAAVRKSVIDMRRSKADRVARSAPKAIRAEVKESLREATVD